MNEWYDDFLTVQNELAQELTLMATQLSSANELIASEMPKALQLFKRLNEIASERGIPTE